MAGWDDISAPVDATATPPEAAPAEAVPTAPAATASVDKGSVVDSIAESIAKHGEKSADKPNPYAEVGPVNPKTGDRPYGKYQIMGKNLPQWLEEAGLGQMQPNDFLNNPNAQETVAKHRITKYYDEHGNARDVASMWHSGVPYERAAAEARADALGTKTTDYADRVAAGVGETPPTTAPAAATSWDAISKPVTPEAAPSKATTTTTTTTTGAPTTPAPEPDFGAIRSMDIDQYGRKLNKDFGLDEDHWFGKTTANLGKPMSDALYDIYDVIRHPSMDPSFQAKAAEALKMAHIIGVPAEAIGNVFSQAAIDAKLDPNATGIIGMLGSLLGAKYTFPEGAAVEKPPVPVAAATTEAGAAEAASAAQRVATEAAAPTVKSTEAATRAQEALNPPRPLPPEQPGPPAPPVGPREAGGVLQKATTAGAEAEKAGVQSEYNAISSEASGASLPPERSQDIVNQVRNLREQYGAEWQTPDAAEAMAASTAGEALPKGKWVGGLITGQQAKVLDEIEETAKSGAQIPYPMAEDFKRLLDTVLPYRDMSGMNPKMADLYRFKLGFRDMMRDTLNTVDPKLAERFDAANQRWIGVQQSRKFAESLAKQEPEEAFTSIFGGGKSAQQGALAQTTMRQIEADAKNAGEVAAAKDVLHRGWIQQVINKATDKVTGELDPKKLISQYNGTDPEFLDALSNKGTKQFFEALAGEQVSAKRAAEWAKAAEKYASDVADGKTPTGKPPTWAMVTAQGLEVIVGATVGEPIGMAIGHPFIGTMAGIHMTRVLLPPDRLARAISNPAIGRLLSRALKTPVNAAALPVLISELKKAGVDVQSKEEKK
jgi:hypothetical protein